MKVISLLQPWATLVVIGAKKIETRSWNTTYRGPLAIHASRKVTRQQVDLARSQPFWDALKSFDKLPAGAIIGSVTVGETFFTQDAEAWIREAWIRTVNSSGKMTEDQLEAQLSGMVARERAFGDYTSGRVGWRLTDPVIFARPVPAKGSLGLWEFPICRKCGCTDEDCRVCIEKTGSPCSWVADGLCSACARQ